MVADAGTAFSSAIAPEFEAVVSLDRLEVFRFLAGILYQLAVVIAGNTVDVLMVDKMALCNGAVGLADQFAILENLVTLVEILEGDLVAIGDVFLSADGEKLAAFLVDNILSLCNLRDTGHDIVDLIHHQCVDFHGCPPIELC